MKRQGYRNEEEILIKLEGVTTREAALKLTQKEVWFTEADLKKFSAKSSPINLLGYTIINEENPLGEIIEVIEQAHQMLCRLEIKKKEVLIPLNEDTLKKIDHKKKEVIVRSTGRVSGNIPGLNHLNPLIKSAINFIL